MNNRRKIIRTKLVSSLAVLLLLTLVLGGLIPVFASSQGEPDFRDHYKTNKQDMEYHVTRVLVERENVIVILNFYGYRYEEYDLDPYGNKIIVSSTPYYTSYAQRPIANPGYDETPVYSVTLYASHVPYFSGIHYGLTWMFVEERYNYFQAYQAGHKPVFFADSRGFLWRVESDDEFYDEYYPKTLDYSYSTRTYEKLNLGLPGVTVYTYNIYPPPADINNPNPPQEGGVQGEDEE